MIWPGRVGEFHDQHGVWFEASNCAKVFALVKLEAG